LARRRRLASLTANPVTEADLGWSSPHKPPSYGGKSKERELVMKTKAISAVAAVLALGCFGTAALAADGLPDDPNSNANTIPGPDATTPSDPAADDNPSARVPTTDDDYQMRREGQQRGTSGEGNMRRDQDDN
jgi:hypothetical protein